MSAARLQVHIARIVVDGAEGLDAQALRAGIGEAIERALTGKDSTAAIAGALQAGPDALARYCTDRIGGAVQGALSGRPAQGPGGVQRPGGMEA